MESEFKSDLGENYGDIAADTWISFPEDTAGELHLKLVNINANSKAKAKTKSWMKL